MVALANDWRLSEAEANRFLQPSQIIARYRQMFGTQPLPNAPLQSILMLTVQCENLDKMMELMLED